MNGRRSRLRRRERARARRDGEQHQPNQESHELLIRLRVVRDEKLADNGRRRSEDLAQLEAYYRAERQLVWDQFHGLCQALRDGKRIVVAEPEILAEEVRGRSPVRRFVDWLFRRQPTPIQVEVSS